MGLLDLFLKKAYYLGKAKIGNRKTDARLYRCEPPLEGNEYVVVSAAHTIQGPETYAFPSNELGEVVNWLELGCSRCGKWSHEDILYEAGYKVIK